MENELLGKKVQCVDMPTDSFFQAVEGIVTDICNGWATVCAARVMSKWDTTWQDHPGSCSTSCKVSNVELVDI